MTGKADLAKLLAKRPALERLNPTSPERESEPMPPDVASWFGVVGICLAEKWIKGEYTVSDGELLTDICTREQGHTITPEKWQKVLATLCVPGRVMQFLLCDDAPGSFVINQPALDEFWASSEKAAFLTLYGGPTTLRDPSTDDEREWCWWLRSLRARHLKAVLLHEPSYNRLSPLEREHLNAALGLTVRELGKCLTGAVPGRSRALGVVASRPSGVDDLKVFLCYASEDKEAVRSLHGRLNSDGVRPWFDEKELLPGQDWDLEIRKAVRTSDVVIVCLSPRAVTKRGYVQKEIRLALDVADEQPEGAIFLIPAMLENTDVPIRLQKWQWVNLTNPDGYERLVAALRAREGLLAQVPTKPRTAMSTQSTGNPNQTEAEQSRGKPQAQATPADVVRACIVFDTVGVSTRLVEYGVVYRSYGQNTLNNAFLEGVILERGKGAQTVPWTALHAIIVRDRESAEVRLRDATTIPGVKLRAGTIVGTDEFGAAFSIGIFDVRTIEVERRRGESDEAPEAGAPAATIAPPGSKHSINIQATNPSPASGDKRAYREGGKHGPSTYRGEVTFNDGTTVLFSWISCPIGTAFGSDIANASAPFSVSIQKMKPPRELHFNTIRRIQFLELTDPERDEAARVLPLYPFRKADVRFDDGEILESVFLYSGAQGRDFWEYRSEHEAGALNDATLVVFADDANGA